MLPASVYSNQLILGAIMASEQRTYYIIYETKNLINGKLYRGQHRTLNVHDNYLGSGSVFKSAVRKYGKKNFVVTHLCYALSNDDMNWLEKNIFVNSEWVESENTYNVKVGGQGDAIDECMLMEKNLRRRETMIKRFGAPSTYESPILMEKIKKTNTERYGTEHPMQSDEVKENLVNSFKRKYGDDVTAPMYIPNIYEKMKENKMAKYGVEHQMHIPEVLEKIKSTNLDRYGVEWNLSSDIVRDKQKAGCMERYGVEFVTQTQEFKDNNTKIFEDKYGVGITNPFMADEVKEKIKNILLEKYGVDHYSKTDEFKKLISMSSRKYQYMLKSPDGAEYQTTSLTAFCKEKNLHLGSFYHNIFNSGEMSGTVPIRNHFSKKISTKTTNTYGWFIARSLLEKNDK